MLPLLLTKVAPGILNVFTPTLSVIFAVIRIVSVWSSVVSDGSAETERLLIVGADVSVLVIVTVSLREALLPAVSCA